MLPVTEGLLVAVLGSIWYCWFLLLGRSHNVCAESHSILDGPAGLL